jgi:hypothetical protein
MSVSLRVVSFVGRFVLTGVAGISVTLPATAASVQTLETYIDDLKRPAEFDIRDVKATFAFVFNSLPERVNVYPTENYYYFKFVHGGVPFTGNIRLDYASREEGKIHFVYQEELAPWRDAGEVRHILLQSSDGLQVEKLAAFEYRMTYAGKSVTFALNDLTQIKPADGLLAAGERYIGPIFDESGLRFFLLYNGKFRIFHYVLDETVPTSDELAPSRAGERIVIGKRTGFAFYRDEKIDRKILIGVYEGNVRANNYFDGPFDQLPDNFIEGEALRSAILEVEPRLNGRIDRFGSFDGGKARYAISPYLTYEVEDDLALFQRCATSKKVPVARYHACFAVELDDGSKRLPRTIAEGGQVGRPKKRGR